MFLTLTEIGKLYNISAIKTGDILYKLGVRDPNHPEVKGFPYEQYIIHNMAHANLGADGNIRYFTYDISTIKEEFEALVHKDKPNPQDILINKISILHEGLKEIKDLEVKEKLDHYLSDITYCIEQNNLRLSMPLDEKAQELYERLKTYRKHKSKAQNISAFLIFSNSVLHILSYKQPKDLEELIKIKGIGDKKVQMYGDEIINIIQSF